MGVARCYRCQHYGHAAKHCNSTKHSCSNCEEEHDFKECKNKVKPTAVEKERLRTGIQPLVENALSIRKRQRHTMILCIIDCRICEVNVGRRKNHH